MLFVGITWLLAGYIPLFPIVVGFLGIQGLAIFGGIKLLEEPKRRGIVECH